MTISWQETHLDVVELKSDWTVQGLTITSKGIK